MSNSFRTAFAGSFASGVVVRPLSRMPDVAGVDPEAGDVIDDTVVRTSLQRSFDRPEATERSRDLLDS